MSEVGRLQYLSQQCVADSERWFGDAVQWKTLPGVIHHALALAGEVGEFCNIIKKIDRKSLSMKDPVVRNNLAMELTDCLVYLLNLAGLLGVDLDRTFEIVRGKNESRFMAERRKRDLVAAEQNGNAH